MLRLGRSRTNGFTSISSTPGGCKATLGTRGLVFDDFDILEKIELVRIIDSP